MKLYLIKTQRDTYATNANTASHAVAKFDLAYPDYEYEKIKEIPIETLVGLEDNDSIIFF